MMRPRRGVALVLVLWLVVVLAAVAAAAASAARARVDVSANLRARLEARLAAESGVVAAEATLGRALAAYADSLARRRYLNRLDRAIGEAASGSLGDARFRVALVDVSARLDVNLATEDQLARFLAAFAGPATARTLARRVRARVDGTGPATARPFTTLDELREVDGMHEALLERVVPHLTVDGDGQVNVETAAPAVRAVAGGAVVRAPSRVLVVSRGWREGHALTREIQVVYDLSAGRPALVRWRERDL